MNERTNEIMYEMDLILNCRYETARIIASLDFVSAVQYMITVFLYIKKIKNAPSALLSYINTLEFLRAREKF